MIQFLPGRTRQNGVGGRRLRKIHIVRRQSLTSSTESDPLFPVTPMFLVRRGSLTPVIESDSIKFVYYESIKREPIVQAPVIESDTP
jgi:hypothetical protein